MLLTLKATFTLTSDQTGVLTLQSQSPRNRATFFDKASLDPAACTGRSIRVRGWLTKRNGPMIRATHPEQIELLDR